MNTHIEEFLDKYIRTDCLNYAVLIKGEWGSGKTFYIKKVIDKLADKHKRKYIYISLYGIDRLSQIDDIILSGLCPVENRFQILGKIPIGTAKSVATGFLSKIMTQDGAEKLTNNIAKTVIGQNKKNILIFDDLERSSVEPKAVMGYINYFVEHQDCRVLILANEEMLEAKEIMEKTIGKVFKITAEIDSAYDSFAESETKITDILKNHKNLIIDIFKKAEFTILIMF